MSRASESKYASHGSAPTGQISPSSLNGNRRGPSSASTNTPVRVQRSERNASSPPSSVRSVPGFMGSGPGCHTTRRTADAITLTCVRGGRPGRSMGTVGLTIRWGGSRSSKLSCPDLYSSTTPGSRSPPTSSTTAAGFEATPPFGPVPPVRAQRSGLA